MNAIIVITEKRNIRKDVVIEFGSIAMLRLKLAWMNIFSVHKGLRNGIGEITPVGGEVGILSITADWLMSSLLVDGQPVKTIIYDMDTVRVRVKNGRG